MLIQGKISDKTTGELLPGANVYFTASGGVYIPGTTGTYTDQFGNFAIDGVGEYLTASYTGYRNLTLRVDPTVNFDLTSGSDLPEVNIIDTALWPRILVVIVTTIVVIWVLKPFSP